MTKTYQLTRLFSLVMPVATAAGVEIVEFRGVQNMKMRGLFTTSNPELQQAIEATGEFARRVFRVVSVEQNESADASEQAIAGKNEPKNTRKAAKDNLFA